jgi:hypothetical protein
MSTAPGSMMIRAPGLSRVIFNRELLEWSTFTTSTGYMDAYSSPPAPLGATITEYPKDSRNAYFAFQQIRIIVDAKKHSVLSSVDAEGGMFTLGEHGPPSLVRPAEILQN